MKPKDSITITLIRSIEGGWENTSTIKSNHFNKFHARYQLTTDSLTIGAAINKSIQFEYLLK